MAITAMTFNSKAMLFGSNSKWMAIEETVVIGGKVYPVVGMPDGNKWLARNLDLTWTGLDLNPQYLYSTDPIAAYYDRDETTYGWSGLQYGLLYNKAAVDYLIANASTLFPGWHPVRQGELFNLYLAVGGTLYEPRTGAEHLKTTTGWTNGYPGLDTYGFAMPPAGCAYVFDSTFRDVGIRASHWNTSTGYSSVIYNGMTSGVDSNPAWMRSVRLVKDKE